MAASIDELSRTTSTTPSRQFCLRQQQPNPTMHAKAKIDEEWKGKDGRSLTKREGIKNNWTPKIKINAKGRYNS